ncbi:MAG TPA: LuxR C-terminal-related transcriptional regulator [Gemmatimonadales bacterium]|nr:LuxR C-terminal-related transcriptional regulator [Gemmatimonadales bacterium]
MQNSAIEVLIIDDNPKDVQRARDALGDGASPYHLHVMVGGEDTLTYLRQQPPFVHALPPDVILLALNPPAWHGSQVFDEIRQIDFHPPIIILGQAGNGPASRYLHTGAADYLFKDDLRSLRFAVEQVVMSRRLLRKLSRRQLEVLRLIAEGLATRDIAARLEISGKTVEAHRGELMRRLGIPTVAGLVRYAIRIGLVPLGPTHQDFSAFLPPEPTEPSSS